MCNTSAYRVCVYYFVRVLCVLCVCTVIVWNEHVQEVLCEIVGVLWISSERYTSCGSIANTRNVSVRFYKRRISGSTTVGGLAITARIERGSGGSS